MTSRSTYTNTIGVGPFSFENIGLFSDNIIPYESQLTVLVNGVEKVYTSSTPGATEYSLDKVTKELTLGVSLGLPDTLLIKRETQTESYIDFTNNSPLTAEDLDITAKQSLFIAEEGVDAIEGGDAVLALPQLTDVLSVMSPADGQFLRYSAAVGKWVSQSFTPEGTGPEVNIVTSFPSSPTAGDLIYHSVYGAAYLYDGSQWQFLNGSGAVTTADPGTTVTELSFSTAGSLDAISLTAGWHCFVLRDPEIAANVFSDTPLIPLPHLSNTSGDWVDLTDATQTVSSSARWDRLWVATGLSNNAGELVIDNATFRAEGQTPSVGHQNICGDGTPGTAQTWWGGATEANAALSATAVLCPRFVTGVGEDALTGYTSTSNDDFRSLLWGYNAGIDWGAQDWRITVKMVAFQPGWNGGNNERHFAVSFVPKNWPYLEKDADGWTLTQSTDATGLISAAASDHANVRDTFGHALGFYLGSGTTTTFSSYVVGHPGAFGMPWNGSGPGVLLTTDKNPITNGNPKAFAQLGSPATQDAVNPEDVEDYCLAYTFTVQYEAASGVATVSLVPDSSEEFTLPTPFSYSTPVAAGDYLRDYLSSCGPDVFISHGACGSSYNDVTSNWPDGLVSIKIETL